MLNKTANEIVEEAFEKTAKSKVYNFENSEDDAVMKPSYNWANEHAHPNMNDKEVDSQMKRFYNGQNNIFTNSKFEDSVREQRTKSRLEHETVGKHTLRTLSGGAVGLLGSALVTKNSKAMGITALAGSGAGLGASLIHKQILKNKYNKTKGSTEKVHGDFEDYKKSVKGSELPDYTGEMFMNSATKGHNVR